MANKTVNTQFLYYMGKLLKKYFKILQNNNLNLAVLCILSD